jgi:hypothetical protein
MPRNEKNKKCFIAMTAVIVCFVFAGAVQADSAWLEKQKLLAPDGASENRFGNLVSISGDYAIVGVLSGDVHIYTGSAYIFKRDGTSWILQQKLIASDGADYDNFACSVSISGDYAIVGASGDDSRGSAYLFKRDGTSWVQQQKLAGSDTAYQDGFGNSVSISGDYVIVGAIVDDDKGDGSGSAYIFKREGASWVQEQKLTASDGAAVDFFGCSVSISGDNAIIGAYGDDDKGSSSGSAYIFKRYGASWVQQSKLVASDGAADDRFGYSVSVTVDYAIVGAYYDDDNGASSGSAYIFRWDGANWVQQQKLTAFDGAASDIFGLSVSISGDYAIIGAYGDDDKGSSSGSAYIFRQDGENWVQQQKLTASDGAASDCFGIFVSISGDYAIVGAALDDDHGTNSGSAYIFASTGTGTLTLLAPNGGEQFVAGSTYDITWDTNDVIENVFIEYSADNGANWTGVDTTANSGSYSWTVADVNSNQCLVRVSDAGFPAASDVSDSVFRIYRCTLAHDSNHDCIVDFRDFADFASEWLLCGDPADPDCQR